MRLAWVFLLALPGFAANQPTFTYAVPAGATVSAITVDAAGNTYLTGTTRSTTFPATPGALQTQFVGGRCSFFVTPGGAITYPCTDAFVVKLSPSGTVLFATYLGGEGSQTAASAICVDAESNIYVGGTTGPPSTNDNPDGAADYFPVTPGAAFTNPNNGGAFVAKLNPSGSGLVYATFIPLAPVYPPYPFSMTVDSGGSVYIAGVTQFLSANPFPTTPGAFQATPLNSLVTGVVAKLNASGTALVYATYLSGNSWDEPMGIAVDSSGNAFVTGYTESHDFPVTQGAFETVFPDTRTNGVSGFVTKLNPGGNGLVYSTFLGVTGATGYGYDIKVDSHDEAYVLMTSSPYSAALLWHLTTDGSALVYSIFSQTAAALDLDAGGNAYVTGGIGMDALFAQEPGQSIVSAPWTFQPNFGGSSDGFAMKFGSDGTFDWATYLGGSGTDKASLIAVAPNGSIVVAGTTTSSDFPGLSTPVPAGSTVGFVSSFFPTLTPMNAAGYSSGAIAPGEIIALRGYGLGPAEGVAASGQGLPATLGGVQVLIGGIPAPLFYVQAQQINAQVPWEVAGQTSAPIEVDYSGGISSYATAPVAAVAPGISSINNSDGTVNSAANPARAGDFVSIYGTGGGAMSPPGVTGGFWTAALSTLTLPYSVTIGGVDAQVLYAGSVPTLESGYFQVNVRVPASGGSNLVLTIGGASALTSVAVH